MHIHVGCGNKTVSDPKVFFVEDDPDIARLLRHHLQVAGFSVLGFSTAANVISNARMDRPSLILLDVMLPGQDGFGLCHQLRQSGAPLSGIPIILVTAKMSEEDRVRGLELGADDYITKPFSPGELIARIKAVLRRYEIPRVPDLIKEGELEIDSNAMTVAIRGEAITTSATEFRLIHYLAQHSGRAFTRGEILNAVWNDIPSLTPRAVDVFVRKLRKKIEPDDRHPRYLMTVRGTGYRFEVRK